MQFHLDGFHAGDPRVKPAAPGRGGSLGDELDVLIVGSGPAGLTLAAQLAQCPDIRTAVIERRDGPMTLGQADGVSCRSMEMFNAFGFGGRVAAEGYQVNEVAFWMPDVDDPNRITRVARVTDVPEDLSEMPHIILNQARVHDYFLETMRNAPTRLDVVYGYEFVDLEIDRNAAYPVAATIRDLSRDTTRTVRARYLVGCDGARSRVRSAIGRELRGDYAYQSWGVMDVLAVTDFPDIRFKSIIKSAAEGNVLIILREGGYLVRVYVELESLKARGDSRATDLDDVIDATKRIFRPFDFDVKEVAWWSVYEVGHSLTDKFDDVDDIERYLPHVFIAGDACHTHSAKAGQGMNVSMGDTFNLGWKLIAVLRGWSEPGLLHTYSAERQAVAKALIDFDHAWSRIMSAPPEESGVNEVPLVQRHFVEGLEFTAGLSVRYTPSVITGPGRRQDLAFGFEVGRRFHSAAVLRIADAKRVHLGHVIRADARWHLFLFADRDRRRFDALCTFLEDDPRSPIRAHTPPDGDPDAVISAYGIVQQPHDAVGYDVLPNLLKPRKGRLLITDYEKAFCADPTDDVFDRRGIDRDAGALVVVRPDQHVAEVLSLDDHEGLAVFFGAILDQAERHSRAVSDG